MRDYRAQKRAEAEARQASAHAEGDRQIDEEEAFYAANYFDFQPRVVLGFDGSSSDEVEEPSK
jgi:hypothetical protein